MPKPEIIIKANTAELAQHAARDFMETVVYAIRKRGIAYVALSGGGTPKALFQVLAQPPYQEAIPWDKLHFFWADERMVPLDAPESNYGQVQELLFRHVPADPNKIHAVNTSLSPQAAAEAYTETMRSVNLNDQETPRFDWCLLGMGEDGHTASLFPGSEPNPDTPTLPVEADYQGRPAKRVTLTPLAINRARRVVFLVSGENKAETLFKVLQGPQDVLNLPAQRIQPHNGRLIWMIDQAAASRLG